MNHRAAPTTTAPAQHSTNDYQELLERHLATQPRTVMGYRLDNGEHIWIKRAGTPHGAGGYRAMAALAGLLRLPVLRPVPHPGGTAAIATEVRRLAELAARGVRVPEVLATAPGGFAMRHLGRPGEEKTSLGDEIDHAARAGDAAAVLALWQQGLDALAHAHRQGACLSQAFARNMVRCDGGAAVACIDFEDDPAAVLPLDICHARDALCYAHSTGIYLHTSGALAEARERWAAWAALGSAPMQAALATSVRRLHWLRFLPASRRLGRDLQRVRAAYELLR